MVQAQLYMPDTDFSKALREKLGMTFFDKISRFNNIYYCLLLFII